MTDYTYPILTDDGELKASVGAPRTRTGGSTDTRIMIPVGHTTHQQGEWIIRRWLPLTATLAEQERAIREVAAQVEDEMRCGAPTTADATAWRAYVHAAATLDELCERLREAAAYEAEHAEPHDIIGHLDEPGLPTYGGPDVADTSGIWSWDATRWLISEAADGSAWAIVPRSDTAGLIRPAAAQKRAGTIITTKSWVNIHAEDGEAIIRGSEVKDLDEALQENCMRRLFVHDADTLDLIRTVYYDASEAWEWADYAAHIRDLLDGGDGHNRIADEEEEGG